jgi:hypothetical protein
MDTHISAQTRLCRNCENFIARLGKKPDVWEYVPAEYGGHTQPMLQSPAWDPGKDRTKKSFESAYRSKNFSAKAAQVRKGKGFADGDVKDLFLLGLFCFCLLVVNLVCWSFLGSVHASRWGSLLAACFNW